jgi:transposase
MSPTARTNSQSQVIVLSILHGGLSPTQAAARFGVSREWIYQLLAPATKPVALRL